MGIKYLGLYDKCLVYMYLAATCTTYNDGVSKLLAMYCVSLCQSNFPGANSELNGKVSVP